MLSEFTNLVHQVHDAASNQFLSGGLVLGIIGGSIAMLRRIPGRLWNWFLRLFTISIDVVSNDSAYQSIMLWLSQQPYMRKARRLSIKRLNDKIVLVPSHGNHFLMWQNRPTWIHWVDENAGSGELSGLVTKEKITIRIFGRCQDTVIALFREAEKLGKIDMSGKLQIYLRKGQWEGGWRYETRKPRTMQTIFLPATANDLVSDAATFLTKREWYDQRGIPYRRGYLFFGPPGSGKSSAAIGLASELGIPLYILNLATITNDTDLEKAIFSIDTTNPSIVLIEDIDTAVPDRTLDKNAKHFSLGTLLNVLDGVVARENIILIVTTNNKDILDPALLRPGRIDQRIEFGHATVQQLESAIRVFIPGDGRQAKEKLFPLAGSISMAEVQEVLHAMALEQK